MTPQLVRALPGFLVGRYPSDVSGSVCEPKVPVAVREPTGGNRAGTGAADGVDNSWAGTGVRMY